MPIVTYMKEHRSARYTIELKNNKTGDVISIGFNDLDKGLIAITDEINQLKMRGIND